MRIVLVHGSCHGAWCWRDVLPLLTAARQDAVAIDLPSHGQDPTPPDRVTLDLYADAILSAVGKGALVVGHSMAGFPISLAAERAPDLVAGLVYVCAYAPVSGKSLAQMRREGPRQPLRDAIVVEGGCFTFDPAKTRDRLYHDCPDETVAYAAARLCPQPILPQETVIALGAAYVGVPKRYVICAEDRAIPPEYQATMTEGWPDGTVTRLPSSHSPFFSMPDRLAALILAGVT
jgi:pimeloyl-ACP methyl ester carboxylesterase